MWTVITGTQFFATTACNTMTDNLHRPQNRCSHETCKGRISDSSSAGLLNIKWKWSLHVVTYSSESFKHFGDLHRRSFVRQFCGVFSFLSSSLIRFWMRTNLGANDACTTAMEQDRRGSERGMKPSNTAFEIRNGKFLFACARKMHKNNRKSDKSD